MVDVLLPYAESTTTGGWTAAPRAGSLRGRTVGIVNNGWRCMDVLAAELRVALAEYGVRDVDERQTAATQAMPDADLADLAGRCAAVVVGIGN